MGRKKRTEPRDLDFETKVVAWLSSQGKHQKQIARALDVSQSQVALLKQRAEENGLLKTVCTLPEDELRTIQQRSFPYEQIMSRLAQLAAAHAAPPPRDLRVFESGGEANDQEGYDLRLRRFGRAAAGRVAGLLAGARLVGVTWGKAIASLVQGLHEFYPKPPALAHPLQFLPVCGVLLDDPNIRLSSSSLVAELHAIFGGGSAGAMSLGAVPMRMPYACYHDARKRATIYEFLGGATGYGRVFRGGKDEHGKKHEPLIDQMDCVLTSVGTAYHQSQDPWLMDMLRREDLTPEELERMAVGDIGGVFLPSPRLRAAERKRVEGLNERLTGIKETHFQRCARAAAAEQKPGVIVLAAGKAKAGIIRECIKHGFITELIIDHDLAHELADSPPAGLDHG